MPKPASNLDDRMDTLRQSGRPFAIATVVRTVAANSARPGAKAIILEDGTIAEGWIGGGCARGAVARAARDAIADGAPRFVSLRPEDLLEAEGVSPGQERDGIRFVRNGCPSRGSMDVFVEPVLPRPELVICGDSPVALAVVDLASRFDFSRTLAAPGLSGAPGLDLDRVLDRFAFETGNPGNRFIVIATQGKSDEAALRAALAAGAIYVAFVGSRRKFATLRSRLAAEGVPEEVLEAVHAPAGLDISAITPDEIALSILAEMVRLRRQGQRVETVKG
jgi:xanthine dehydrogenase accessory factor